MSRTRVLLWSTLAIIVGVALALLLLSAESPRGVDGELDRVNIGLFIVALMVAVGGLGAIVALLFHARWPALAGRRRGAPDPAVALRQGALAGLVTGVLSLLLLLDRLDVTFVLVTMAIAGLVEAYLQTRG